MALTAMSSFTRIGLRVALPSNWKLYSTARNVSKYNDDDKGSHETVSNSNKFESKSKSNNEGESKRIADEKDDILIHSEILNAALKHVNVKGWTMAAIRAGAEDVYSAGEIGEIFDEYDLVKYFITSCNHELESHLTQTPLNLTQALEYRLSKVTPFAPRFNEVLAHATHPANVAQSVELLLRLADSIAHHALKDTSTNLTWYSKRLGIASIYVASELCFVQDKSPNFANTFQFINRRVQEFEQFKTGPGSLPLPDIMSAGFTTLMNILGRNAPR